MTFDEILDLTAEVFVKQNNKSKKGRYLVCHTADNYEYECNNQNGF